MLADKCHVILEELGLAAKSKTKCHSFHCLILFIPYGVNELFFQLICGFRFTHAYHVNRVHKSYLPVQYFPPLV